MYKLFERTLLLFVISKLVEKIKLSSIVKTIIDFDNVKKIKKKRKKREKLEEQSEEEKEKNLFLIPKLIKSLWIYP